MEPSIGHDKKLNLLTNEGETGGEHEKKAIAENSKCDGKVGSNAAPQKELIDRCPVIGVKKHLENTKTVFYSAFLGDMLSS